MLRRALDWIDILTYFRGLMGLSKFFCIIPTNCLTVIWDTTYVFAATMSSFKFLLARLSFDDQQTRPKVGEPRRSICSFQPSGTMTITILLT